MIDVSVLVDKLNGMECEEIRSFLQAEGIKGYKQLSHACPISQWIRKESGHEVVTEDSVETLDEIGRYRLAEGPKEFIYRFDGGLFPELALPEPFVDDDDYQLQDDYSSVDD